MSVISCNTKLLEFCNLIKDSHHISIDTEFSRDKTYYPKLCLLQISDGINKAAIDPMQNIDLSPLWQIILDDNITKIFHSAKQDIEIIYNITGRVPQNIFDTQIVASVCGYKDSISYENLVNEIFKINLDKSQRYTDWSKRPLSKKQIKYALNDVEFLPELYEILKAELDNRKRSDWISEEMKNLTNKASYEIDIDNIWHKIKFQSKSKKFIYSVIEFAKWREIKAQYLNLPREKFLSDIVILELSSILPDEIEKFSNYPRLGKIPTEYFQEIIEISNNINNQQQYKVPSQNAAHDYRPVNQSKLLMLKFFLQLKASQLQIPERLIASTEDLKAFCRGNKNIPATRGWRNDVFGKDLELLMQGKIAISLENDEIKILQNNNI